MFVPGRQAWPSRSALMIGGLFTRTEIVAAPKSQTRRSHHRCRSLILGVGRHAGEPRRPVLVHEPPVLSNDRSAARW